MGRVWTRAPGAVIALMVALGCVTGAWARRAPFFDPGSLWYASCENVAYDTDAADVATAHEGESLTGLGGDDVLTGAARTQCLTGGDGNDTLTAAGTATWLDGGPGNDRLTGGPASDSTKAGEGDDLIRGGPGDDLIDGDAGNDTIDGGAGNDTISGGPGRNTIDAGPGNDLISSNDGVRESINCGSGDDTVHADRSDRLRHCERVAYRANPYPTVRPRAGSTRTVFTLKYLAPYTTDTGDELSIAAYDEVVVRAPKPSCHPRIDLQSSRPATPVSGSHVVEEFVLRVHGTACRGVYRIGVAYRDSSAEVECDGIAGAHPRRSGDYGSCAYAETIGYATLRIR